MDYVSGNVNDNVPGIYFIYICFWLHWVSIAFAQLSLLMVSGGLLLVVVRGLLIVVASLVAEHRL